MSAPRFEWQPLGGPRTDEITVVAEGYPTQALRLRTYCRMASGKDVEVDGCWIPAQAIRALTEWVASGDWRTGRSKKCVGLRPLNLSEDRTPEQLHDDGDCCCDNEAGESCVVCS